MITLKQFAIVRESALAACEANPYPVKSQFKYSRQSLAESSNRKNQGNPATVRNYIDRST